MARIGAQTRPPPAPRREYERASNRGARVRSAEILRIQPAQVRWRQLSAIAAPAQQRTPPTRARQQCRYDRCPPPQQLIAGSRQTPEPGALLAPCIAGDRATPEQFRTRKGRMQLSAQTWTPESRSLHEKKIVLPADMGSAGPG